MTLAQGSRSSLAYIAETTFGTTPATPTLVNLPFNTHSLDLTKERVQGNEIQSDRMSRVDRHGNRNAAGSVSVDLRKADFDPFLESAMFGSFATNVLKTGVTPQYFSIEDTAADITQYRAFTGMSVSTASFSIAPNQMVTMDMDFVGKDMTQSASSLTVSPVTAPSTNAPFDSYSGVVELGGAGVTIVASIDFSITNSLAPLFVVGSPSAQQLEFGRSIVEGNMTLYYEDAAVINRFLNETESAIEVTVDDPTGTNDYTFLFPRVKYNGAAVPVANEQSRLITVPFVALYDTTEASNLVITRTV